MGAVIRYASLLFVATIIFSLSNFILLYRSLEKYENIDQPFEILLQPKRGPKSDSIAFAKNHFDSKLYERQRSEALKPFSNVTTVGKE